MDQDHANRFRDLCIALVPGEGAGAKMHDQLVAAEQEEELATTAVAEAKRDLIAAIADAKLVKVDVEGAVASWRQGPTRVHDCAQIKCAAAVGALHLARQRFANAQSKRVDAHEAIMVACARHRDHRADPMPES